MTKTSATVFASLNCGSPTDATPLEALHAVVDPLRRVRVAVHVDDDRDRAVEARPEALGEQVVRAAGGLLPSAAFPDRTRPGGRAPRYRPTPAGRAARRRTRHARERSRSAPSERSGSSRERPPSRRSACRNGTFSRSILCPSFASTAMSNEFAISTVVRTPSAEPMPSFVTKSRPKNARPVTEMATVSPAKSTARPAEAPASAAASTW